MKFTRKDKRTNLEKEIDRVLTFMDDVDPDTEDYVATSKNLLALYEAKSKETKKHISPDTIVVVMGNLLGIGLILIHEKTEIITTKALGFILKGRV